MTYAERQQQIDNATRNAASYYKEFKKHLPTDRRSCGFYFGECTFRGDALGTMFRVEYGPVLVYVTDRHGNKVAYPELAGLSARIYNNDKTIHFYRD